MTELINFEDKKVRRVEYNGEWYFSIIDIIAILTDSSIPNRYWTDLKRKLSKDEGFVEVYDKIVQLKLTASDGKKYATDCANTETIFRIIQSIPSPKAEPIKQWLAKVGYERIVEMENPSIAQERVMEIYRKKGYSDEWIFERIQSIIDRKNLTNEWDIRGALKEDYKIFTAIMSKATFGITPSEHKAIKGLKSENLRDNMTRMEIALVNLGEATAYELHKTRDTKGRDNLKKDVKEAGDVAGRARKDIEKRIGKKVVSAERHINLRNNKQIKNISNNKNK